MKDEKFIEVFNTKDIKDEVLMKYSQYLDSNPNITKDNLNLLLLLPDLLTLQNNKSLLYGRSYCKRADLSIFLNLERKWDRLSNIMDGVIENGLKSLSNRQEGTPNETFVDTVVDLSLYGLLWIGYIREKRPENYEEFLKNNNLSQNIPNK